MIITLPWPDKRLSPNARWTADEDAFLKDEWSRSSRTQIAAALGRSVGSISNRAMRLNLSKPRDWTEEELQTLRLAYQTSETSEDLDVAALAEKLGRSYHSVVVKAGRMGLANIKRKGVNVRKDAPKYTSTENRRAAQSEMAKARIVRNGHPRGMAGKKHSDAAKAAIGSATRRHYSELSDETKAARSMATIKTKVERYGCVNPATSRGTWKAGWREIGGKRNYYRSRWEANYARYLEWLRNQGEIVDWVHEPETFWFESIKRGVRSYLPDFRVWEYDGSTKLHEVKGWMDSRSKTTLARMKKYHPHEVVIVIRERDYNAIARTVGRMIEGWETSDRSGRL